MNINQDLECDQVYTKFLGYPYPNTHLSTVKLENWTSLKAY